MNSVSFERIDERLSFTSGKLALKVRGEKIQRASLEVKFFYKV